MAPLDPAREIDLGNGWAACLCCGAEIPPGVVHDCCAPTPRLPVDRADARAFRRLVRALEAADARWSVR